MNLKQTKASKMRWRRSEGFKANRSSLSFHLQVIIIFVRYKTFPTTTKSHAHKHLWRF
jgi:hypothetical protein